MNCDSQLELSLQNQEADTSVFLKKFFRSLPNN